MIFLKQFIERSEQKQKAPYQFIQQSVKTQHEMSFFNNKLPFLRAYVYKFLRENHNCNKSMCVFCPESTVFGLKIMARAFKRR